MNYINPADTGITPQQFDAFINQSSSTGNTILPPTQNTGRSPGDHRTAEQITDNALFSAVKDENWIMNPKVIQGFKDQVGGDWNDPSLTPDQRADVAANAERVLEYIDQAGGNQSNPNNHKIDGKSEFLPAKARLNKFDLTHEGSEARRLLDFSEQGYPALSQQSYNEPTRYNKPVVAL